MIYINHHDIGAGSQLPKTGTLPQNLEYLDKHYGTAEDSSFVYAGFEKYLTKLLKL